MKKIIYLLLSLLIIAFIFGNSMMDATDSNSESRFLTVFVQNVLNWLGFHVPIGELHHAIRKCAHFTEYALEAFFVAKTLTAFRVRRQTWLAYALLIGLLTAVIDENIQLYSIGRSGQVTDVLLDFSGTIVGVVMAMLISWNRR
ncbi:MAG: VanZ family protein [Acholeplasmataceae bacterium]|nr:VanZ family protein [Acholeplasmataceae bacterium]